jgi:NADP-dependent 3-hydroxy acid dehydrogenase YdfG
MSSVLITGASTGIGRLTATELAQRGHRVIATARDRSSLDDLDVAVKLRLDVTDQSSVDAAIAEAGEIDVLIANAGLMTMGAVEAVPTEEVERLFDANVIGLARSVRAVLPQMRTRGKGRLVLLSSVLGRAVLPAFAAYSASKFAVEAYGEALAMELAPFGVDVVIAEPGPTSSGLLEKMKNFTLADDPYKLASPITPEITSPTSDVATAIADLVEAPTVPLRSPLGGFTQYVVEARAGAPWDKPFTLG